MSTYELDARMRILLAAKRLFARQGFDGTTVRALGVESDTNPALVSYYFQGKDKLFEALLDEFFPKELVRETIAAPLEPIAGLKVVIREIVKFQLEDPDLVRVIQNEIGNETCRRDFIREYLTPIWEKIRSLLAEGKLRGVFHYRSLDNAFLYLWGGITYRREFSFFDPVLSEPVPDAERLIEDMVGFALAALRCPDNDRPELALDADPADAS
ncbi:TetR family transcriptional regulator [Cohnella ginsengisoli]|uniref:TetR family transcriptional regulator n=1 Tax=Cohnella ginsengisoli TaxID=425004 RepID=A0A9X4QMX6_9BACL|nr:TetR/AcrR family transcriptional regulator [Cohnella ginsengisoli]MDG0791752.1 TetR family transcriptional regulator [Cohnella ginsengisoli]